ncbi:MAG: methionyl-tRNA formyltransferase [Armatimonadetes bacterium]|nr:methionyl-tRNA formyltransferase [Armatimonadota bacterium]
MMSDAASEIRVVFLGTAEFAVPILRALAADQRFTIPLVITQPDRPRGRGRLQASGPIKQAADHLGLRVAQPVRIRSARFETDLRAIRPTFYVVAAYGRILPQALLDIPRMCPVNVHGSLLPAYRGAAPIQRALMDGCARTGVTTMAMSAEMDAGDILLKAPIPIRPEHNAETLMDDLAHVGAALVVRTLMGLLDGTVCRTPQDHSFATHAPPITPDDTIIEWAERADAIHNRIRAMAPRPGAVTWHRGRRLKVLSSAACPALGDAPPGAICAMDAAGVAVATGIGAVRLIEVQPEGKRPMLSAEWARGARIGLGDMLGRSEADSATAR